MAISLTNVIKKVPEAAKKISGKPLGVASKVFGVSTIASVLYDAHVNGSEKADVYDSKATANKLYNDNNQYLTMNRKSATIAKFKRCWYDFQQGLGILHFGNRVKGYTSEFCSTIGANLPYLALAAVALKFKNAGKIAGAALGVLGLKTLLFDVAGLGAKKEKI